MILNDNIKYKTFHFGTRIEYNELIKLPKVEKGSGIINMYSRARLINAKIDIQSKVGEGTSLKLNYPIQITSNV